MSTERCPGSRIVGTCWDTTGRRSCPICQQWLKLCRDGTLRAHKLSAYGRKYGLQELERVANG